MSFGGPSSYPAETARPFTVIWAIVAPPPPPPRIGLIEIFCLQSAVEHCVYSGSKSTTYLYANYSRFRLVAVPLKIHAEKYMVCLKTTNSIFQQSFYLRSVYKLRYAIEVGR